MLIILYYIILLYAIFVYRRCGKTRAVGRRGGIRASSSLDGAALNDPEALGQKQTKGP